MTELHGRILAPDQLTDENRKTMHALMADHYDDTSWTAFLHDLSDKDECIVLTDGEGVIRGFSTQKHLSVTVDGRVEHGVFSGDTIIHRDWWGSMELYRLFAERYIVRRNSDGERLWWFLISKGYKTYRMLPLFFRTFWPSCLEETPEAARQLMRAFGQIRYPGEYDDASGVIRYKGVKDRLKPGVADVGEKQLRDRHVRFFLEQNPDWALGNDLVCLAELSEENLKASAARLLLGDAEPDGAGRDGAEQDGADQDGTGRDGAEQDGADQDGTGRYDKVWDGTDQNGAPSC